MDNYQDYLNSLDDKTLTELIKVFSNNKRIGILKEELKNEEEKRANLRKEEKDRVYYSSKVGKYYFFLDVDNSKNYYAIKKYDTQSKYYVCDYVGINEASTENTHSFSRCTHENAIFSPTLFNGNNVKEITREEYEQASQNTGQNTRPTFRIPYETLDVEEAFNELTKDFRKVLRVSQKSSREIINKGKFFLNSILDETAKYLEENYEEDNEEEC